MVLPIHSSPYQHDPSRTKLSLNPSISSHHNFRSAGELPKQSLSIDTAHLPVQHLNQGLRRISFK